MSIPENRTTPVTVVETEAVAPVAPTERLETAEPASPPVSSEDYAAVPIGNGRTVRENALDREKAEFGGIKFGSAFFGWLSAMGLATILTAVVAGTGVALGLGDATGATDGTVDQIPAPIGIGGVIAVVVILFVSYFAGGYVAGRMARFSGAKQGVAVWLWALVVAIVLGIVAAIAGGSFDILGTINAFPRLPIGEGALTTLGIATVVIATLLPLLAAVLGGVAGMRFHRRVDRVGLGR